MKLVTIEFKGQKVHNFVHYCLKYTAPTDNHDQLLKEFHNEWQNNRGFGKSFGHSVGMALEDYEQSKDDPQYLHSYLCRKFDQVNDEILRISKSE
ncbi:MAG: hypothetical protein EOP06_03805 [Proteobacteria bacterium]|nr:MAG: hypothetical protein EOP06_03805 [Pseudomonadota bacterium]